MTIETVLTDEQIGKAYESMPSLYHYSMFARAIEQAVLQSPEVQRLREAQDQRDIAITMLADWCAAIKRNGTGWDDWDEHYKDAAFRPGPLRDLIDAAMEKQP